MTPLLFVAALVFVPLALLIMLLVRGGVSIRASLDVGPVRPPAREIVHRTHEDASAQSAQPTKTKRERTNTGIAPAARGKPAKDAKDPAQSYTEQHPAPDLKHPHAMGTWSTETPAMPTVITREARETRGDS